MSRPKKCDYKDSAKGRIEKAFWTVLEKEGFHSVTMLRLAQESGLNRNTVYYHFGNVREVARFAFNNSFSDRESKLFINVILSGNPAFSSDFKDLDLLSHVKKIRLFVKSGSPLLISIVKESLKNGWFSNVGISEKLLTKTDKIQVEYIVSGFVGIMGNSGFTDDFSVLKTLPRTSIGKAAINALKEIAEKQR